MSTLNVDKVDPSSGTALELGTSGDTITVPTGAGLTVVDEVKTNKVSPATGTAFALGDSGDTFTVPSGATIVNSGTATGFGITAASFLPNANPIIINGNMVVAQRAVSKTGQTASGFETCDRVQFVANDAGTWTIIQETQTTGSAYDNGLKEAYRIDCTTADASVAADSALFLKYKMEGFDVQEFKKGTTNAETYTLSFWVKSNVTGTGQVNMRDETNNRMCSATYTTDVTNTWEKKVLNFAADTSGPSACTNAEALAIEWWVAAGTDYSSGTAPTAWETIANTDRAAAVTLALSGSTSNDFSITGVQLEVGTYTSSTIPPFQFENYGTSLQRCKRYYQMIASGAVQGTDGGYTERLGGGYFHTNIDFFFDVRLVVELRANPSLETVMGTDYVVINKGGGSDSSDNVQSYTSSTYNILTLKCSDNVSGTQGEGGQAMVGNSAARVAVDAEL